MKLIFFLLICNIQAHHAKMSAGNGNKRVKNGMAVEYQYVTIENPQTTFTCVLNTPDGFLSSTETDNKYDAVREKSSIEKYRNGIVNSKQKNHISK